MDAGRDVGGLDPALDGPAFVLREQSFLFVEISSVQGLGVTGAGAARAGVALVAGLFDVVEAGVLSGG